MERAVLVPRADRLGATAWKGCDRLYFGSGFCERLIPTPDELGTAMDLAREHGAAFTLVTPPVTRDGLDRLERLLPLLPPRTEVVANDWGALALVRRAGGLEPVLGGLLHKQKRGPIGPEAGTKLTTEAWERIRTTNADVPAMRGLLAALGVGRVEVELPLHGVSLDLARGEHPLRGSLHRPYACVAATRYCVIALAAGRPGRPEWGVFPCSRPCSRSSFRLDHPTLGVPLHLSGCAMFIRNDALPEDGELGRMGIDRIVESSAPPV